MYNYTTKWLYCNTNKKVKSVNLLIWCCFQKQPSVKSAASVTRNLSLFLSLYILTWREKMTDTDKLEQYIQNTFSNITDDEGRPLDVTIALPLLKQVLTGYTQEITEKKFDYIGESAAQFAINLILAQHYSKYDNRVLSLLAKKLRAPLQLYKLVGKQIAIKEHVRSVYLKDTMDMIIGYS